MKTLKDVMPDSFLSDTIGTKVYDYKDLIVVEHYSLTDNTFKKWVGVHKNVVSWCVLENGVAVGFNENPAGGYSYPTKL